MHTCSLLIVLLCLSSISFAQISQNVTRQTSTSGTLGTLVRDNQGNFLNSGGVNNDMNFGGQQYTGNGIYLVKYDTNMNHIFSYKYGTIGAANALGTDSQNNIILAGSWSSGNLTFGGPILRNSGATDFFVAKLNSAGQHLWSQKFNNSAAQSLAVAADDSIAICGLLFYNTTVGGSLLPVLGQDWFIARYSSNGAHLWSIRLGGQSNDMASAIAVDSAGNYFVGGNYQGFDFVIAGTTLPYVPTADNIVVKLDPNGNILWYKVFGSSGYDTVQSVAFDLSGNTLVVGYAAGTIDLVQPHNGGNDILVAKYSSSGVFQWSKLMGSSGNDVAYDIRTGSNDTVYVTGVYTMNTTVGGASLANTTSGMFVAKYASDGSHIWSQGYPSSTGNSAGKRMAVDNQWNRIAYGFDYTGTLTFGGTPITSLGSVQTLGFVLLSESGAIPSPAPTPSSSPSPVSASSSPSPSLAASQSPSSSPSRTPSPSASPSPSVCLPCLSDSDCTNGQGICSNATYPKYCSCLSGFGGCNCNIRPASACEASYQQVADLSATFKVNASMDYLGYNLYLNVDAPLQETAFTNPSIGNSANSYPYSLDTLVYFGSSPDSYPNCTFPMRSVWSDLAAVAGGCVDSYASNLTWTYARTYCGFVAANNTKNYTSEMTVSRRYITSSSAERIEQSTRTLNVVFPSEVTVSQSLVTVTFPSAGLIATITYVDYNPSNDKWIVRVSTSVDSNYFISNSSAVTSVTSALASLSRSPSLAVSPCAISGLLCNQILTYTFPQGTALDACQGLLGSVATAIDIQCAGACAPINNTQLTMTLDTSDSCPIVDTIDFSVASLSAYSDSGLTNPTTIFDNNDVAFFGADVQSNEAVIQSKSVKPGSVCFQNTTGSCIAVQYTTLSATNGKSPVFSVNFADSTNQAIFGGILNPTAFTVRATIEVSFVGAKSLHAKSTVTQNVDLAIATFMQSGSSPSPDSVMSSSSSLIPLSMGTLLFVFALV